VLVGLDAVAMLPPEPEIILQLPMPVEGVFAARVVVVRPHIEAPVWSGPALAVVGTWANVIVTSSEDELHGGLLIVQRNT